jgi:hypothetical protein
MALVAGLALGIWLLIPELLQRSPGEIEELILYSATCLLGGLTVVGPALLLIELRRSRRPWREGKLLWFSLGMAEWLLWPPMVVARAQGKSMSDTEASICFAYGTPLMAIYVTASLLAGGWLRPNRRRRLKHSWREQFGLLLGLAWACTGCYVLYLIYKHQFYD